MHDYLVNTFIYISPVQEAKSLHVKEINPKGSNHNNSKGSLPSESAHPKKPSKLASLLPIPPVHKTTPKVGSARVLTSLEHIEMMEERDRKKKEEVKKKEQRKEEKLRKKAIIEEEKLRKKTLIEERKKKGRNQHQKRRKVHECVLNIFQLHIHLTVTLDHVVQTSQKLRRQTSESANKALKGRFNLV